VGLTSRLDEAPDAEVSGLDRDALAPVRDVLSGAWLALDPAAVHPHLTRRENLAFAAVAARNARAADAIDRALLALAAEEGLTDDLLRGGLDAPVGPGGTLLSPAERRSLLLARALLRRTPVLLLDEPTTGLDAAATGRVARALRARRDGRVTVVATTDPVLAAAADEVVLLEDRRVAARGDPATVLGRLGAPSPLRARGPR
jgi:ABC-type multidrug transport system fused ATPase/permease subunit